jgi:hypothetical protein
VECVADGAAGTQNKTNPRHRANSS